MEQNFGVFVREKRLEKGLKLKTFATLVGISPVYESYIENSKRPAPAERVLIRMVQALCLSPEDTERLMSLALTSHGGPALPQDLIDYINENKCVYEALKTAKECGADENDWLDFIRRLTEK